MAVSAAHVFPGFLTPALAQFSFQSHGLLFSHASEVISDNTQIRKFTSTGYRTYNHQVMSQTCSQLSHPGGRHLFISVIKCQHLYGHISMQILNKSIAQDRESGGILKSISSLPHSMLWLLTGYQQHRV